MSTGLERYILGRAVARQFDYNQPGGVPGVPPHLRSSIYAAWLWGQSFNGSKVLEDLHTGTRRTVQPGRCVNFDGVDDYIAIPHNAAFEYTATGLTVSVWVNSSNVTAYRPIVSKKGASQTGWDLLLNITTGVARFTLRGTGNIDCVGVTGLADGAWHHVAVTVRDTSVSIYVDGVLNKTQTGACTYATSVDNLAIGGRNNTGTPGSINEYFSGKIFDVRIYDRELTPSEIAGIYDTTRLSGRRPDTYLMAGDLVGWWKLDDGDKSTNWNATAALDSSGNGNHGAAKNTGSSFDYLGVDVPCSFQNELGYAEWKASYTPPAWTAVYDDDPGGSWLASGTDGKATALTGQTWRGRTGLKAVKFTSGALAGYSANRVYHSGLAHVSTAGELWQFTCDVALSRPLATGEGVIVYVGGGATGPIITVAPASGTDAVPADQTKWNHYTANVRVYSSAGLSTYPIVYPLADVTGGDLTVYLDNIRIFRTGIAAAVAGPLDQAHWPDYVPRSAALPGQDIHALAVANNGPVPLEALLKNSYCAVTDGVDDTITIPANDTLYPYAAAERTFSGWCYWNTATNDNDTLAVYAGSGTTGQQLYLSNVNTDTGFSLSFNGYRSQCGIRINQRWFHWAIRVPAGATQCQHVELFIDGGKMALSTAGGTPTIALDSAAAAPKNIAFTYCPAKNSDVRIYNVALSDAEIANLAAGVEPSTLPVGHWPCAEGDGTTLYDTSGNANHATVTGATLSTFWSATNSEVHRNIKRGFRVANATGSARTFNGSNTYFSVASAAALQGANQYLWTAAYYTPTVATSARGLVGKYGSAGTYEYLLWTSGADAKFRASNDGTTAPDVTAAGVVSAGVPILLIGYHDPAADVLAISVNGGTPTTFPYSTGIFAGAAAFMIGAHGSTPTNFFNGTLHLAAFGKSASAIDWAALRARIYNGGSPISYADLTAAEKTAFGLVCWYDCDEVEPRLFDKHGGYHLAAASGSCPRIPILDSGASAADGGAINAPAGQWHNGAETAIDFTGGVSAPWTEGLSMPTGYLFGDTPPAKLKRRRHKPASSAGWREDNFYAEV